MTIIRPLSYAAIVARLVALGMVSGEHAEEWLAGLGELRDDDLTSADVPDVLVEIGVAVSAHGEDVDDVGESYRHLLAGAATCTGSVTVTDVALDTGDGGEVLRFLRDGRQYTWRVEHLSDEYLDHLALSENFNDLDPGGDDPRSFHILPQPEPGADSYYVLATPEQAQTLRAEFDLDLG